MAIIVIIMVVRGVLVLAVMTLVVEAAQPGDMAHPLGWHTNFKTVLKAGNTGVPLKHQTTIALNGDCDHTVDLNQHATHCWLHGLSAVRLTLEAPADAAPVLTLLDHDLGRVRIQRTQCSPLPPRCFGDVIFQYTCKYFRQTQQ